MGFIGANVLKGYRLEVDFPNKMTYWEAGPSPDPNDLDIVGLNLRPEADGGYAVAWVAVKDGKPSVEGVSPGDKLISVDGRDTAGLAMGAVVDSLRGAPGTERTLVLERKGERFTVRAKTLRFA
jgi:C-terminal processing protease CtpA/Prc